jgi:hypothetical protein
VNEAAEAVMLTAQRLNDLSKGSTHRIVHFHSEFVGFPLLRLPAWGLAFIHLCKLLLALLVVPKPTRHAIHFSGIVVSRLNRAASANLPTAPLGWLAKPASLQFTRPNSSATIRSARPWDCSRRKSPAWCSPN